MAIKLKGVKCQSVPVRESYNVKSNEWKMITNNIICGGSKFRDERIDCFWFSRRPLNVLESRCKTSQADSAFMFLTAIVVIVAAVLGFSRMKKGH